MPRRDDDTVQIRSFRVCFQLERRIHRIDRWRIPLSYGLPVRGIGYWALVLVTVYVLGRLPITGALLGVLHPSIRFVALPLAGAWALLRWKVDGRSAHATALAWLRMRLEPRRVAAFRPIDPPGRVTLGAVMLATDGRGTRLRRGVVTGTGTMLLRYPVGTRERRGTLYVSARGDEPLWRGKQLELARGQRVVVE